MVFTLGDVDVCSTIGVDALECTRMTCFGNLFAAGCYFLLFTADDQQYQDRQYKDV